ncbi:MAG: electron transporter RnfD [Desulfobacteraceae bacterium 4572_19]|nr:MAG: electron transporter RnfD [Desulfobacteraceae bacterium 4572_19]
MINKIRFVVSHAPFWHDGERINIKHINIILVCLIASIPGINTYGMPAVGVITLAMATAMGWELLLNFITKRPVTIGDGNAALIGLLFAMLCPATMPWWAIITGTFVAIVIGQQIFGGIGANPFNPTLVGIAILVISWSVLFDFEYALENYDTNFVMAYPLTTLKYFGVSQMDVFNLQDLFMGKQAGGIGATCGILLIVGGIYLIIRGFIRWEISVSFILGILITAYIFNLCAPDKYANPLIHLLTGYTLIGAFFLATEDSSSPVNFIPMLIYGAGCGIMTILIRNIGAYEDGVVFAILLMNLVNPLIDKIRPKAMGKVV